MIIYACTFLELTAKLDPATGQVAEENPDFLKTGNAAFVKLNHQTYGNRKNLKKSLKIGSLLGIWVKLLLLDYVLALPQLNRFISS